LTCDEDVPLLIEDAIRGALRPPSDHDEAIGRVEAALVEPAVQSVRDLAEASGLSMRALQRLAKRAFGFPPRLLLRRARFLRSLHAMRAAQRGDGASVIDQSYTDYSHFVRESHEFLGMSPQAFLGHDMPLLKNSLDLRTQVLGAPAQVLDTVVGP
jgi:methylphosphotriester-DNA--protein-cysteine methyltransferase